MEGWDRGRVGREGGEGEEWQSLVEGEGGVASG